MKKLKLHALALVLTLAATSAFAQVAPEESKPAPKGAQPEKSAPKKAPAPKKAAAPRKADTPKAAVAKKTPPPVAGANPGVRVYKAGDPNAPTLRDKEGEVIPTAPDAYDVSSAKK